MAAAGAEGDVTEMRLSHEEDGASDPRVRLCKLQKSEQLPGRGTRCRIQEIQAQVVRNTPLINVNCISIIS